MSWHGKMLKKKRKSGLWTRRKTTFHRDSGDCVHVGVNASYKSVTYDP